jgi:hypothetical protein
VGGVEPGAGPRELARGWLTIATQRAVGAACCLLTGLAWPSLESARPARVGHGDGGPQSSVLIEQLRSGRRHTTAAWHGARDACKPRYGNDPCVEELLALVLAPTGQAAWIVVDTTIEVTLSSQPLLSDPAATFAVYAMGTAGAVNLLDSGRQIDPHSLRLSKGRSLSWLSGGTTHSAPLP